MTDWGRKTIGGVVENELGLDPYSGVPVVFRCAAVENRIRPWP